jgi:5-methylcytosine-specific restriction endonuclease McrA
MKPLSDDKKLRQKLSDAARYARDKEAHRARAKKWKADNAEYVRGYKLGYREKNADKIAVYNEQNKGRQAEWRDGHREEAAGYARAYREKNKKDLAEKRREHYLQNKGKIKSASAKRYQGNKEAAIEYAKQYRVENPQVSAVYAENKRVRKKQGAGRLSRGLPALLLAEQGGKCPYCYGSLGDLGYHLDHYMPLALGGPNEDNNIQLTCPPCNSAKRAKHPDDFLRELGLNDAHMGKNKSGQRPGRDVADRPNRCQRHE